MANMRNKWEFYGSILEALGVDYTEAELKNNETLRAKLLEGLGVEHTYDDVNQYPLWREKLVEGIGNMSGGGGGDPFSPSNFEILEFEFNSTSRKYVSKKAIKEIYDDYKENGTDYAIYLTQEEFPELSTAYNVFDVVYRLVYASIEGEDYTLGFSAISPLPAYATQYGTSFNKGGVDADPDERYITFKDPQY